MSYLTLPIIKFLAIYYQFIFYSVPKAKGIFVMVITCVCGCEYVTPLLVNRITHEAYCA